MSKMVDLKLFFRYNSRWQTIDLPAHYCRMARDVFIRTLIRQSQEQQDLLKSLYSQEFVRLGDEVGPTDENINQFVGPWSVEFLKEFDWKPTIENAECFTHYEDFLDKIKIYINQITSVMESINKMIKLEFSKKEIGTIKNLDADASYCVLVICKYY